MTKAKITFRPGEKRPPLEVCCLVSIKLKHGDMVVKYYGGDGVRSYTLKLESIDTIQVGAQ